MSSSKKVAERWCECGKAKNLQGLRFTHVGPQCESSSPTVTGVHPLSHNRYVCVHTSVPACQVCSLGSLTVCTGCLLFPICEEWCSDMACPFNSLPTFDMPSTEVSMTYFPLAALLLSCNAPQQEGEQRGRSCLRLHCCPGVLNHCHLLGDTFQCVCVCVKVCRRRPTHMRAHMHSHKEAC